MPDILSNVADGVRRVPYQRGRESWVLPWLRLLARGKSLRGSAFDPFGHGAERRLERALIAQFEARLDELLPALRADNLELAQSIAAIPMQMRGYGHVKRASVDAARLREAALLHRFDPARYPDSPPTEAGSFRGVRIGTA